VYKKILVPYDDSEVSNKALENAVDIAKISSKSQVIILHVVEEFPTFYRYIERPARSIKTGGRNTLSQYLEEVYSFMKEDAHNRLNDKKDEIEKKTTGNFEIRTEVLVGHISNSIIDFAAREGIELIVIGSIGLSGISRIKTLGSVSRKVSERAQCPVIIVH
jgi:nucleotide-binding universal stress UspA family protein